MRRRRRRRGASGGESAVSAARSSRLRRRPQRRAAATGVKRMARRREAPAVAAERRRSRASRSPRATRTVLATATRSGRVQTARDSASAVIERLTSTWHDGSVAGAPMSPARSSREWLPRRAARRRPVDAATNLLAPVRRRRRVAGIRGRACRSSRRRSPPRTRSCHMGSPFTLLADSLATFVEESATVSNVVAQAEARGPGC